MELEEFKDWWNQSTERPLPKDYNLAEMIYLDSNSPLAKLEKRYQSSLYLFPLIIIVFGGAFISRGVNQSVTSWLLFAILAVEFLYALLNYLLVKDVGYPAGKIRDNLLKRVFLMEKRSRTYVAIHISLYALMAILLELNVHYHFDADQGWWTTINPTIRVMIYIVFIAGQLILKRYSEKQLYGQYIDQLNGLIREIEA